MADFSIQAPPVPEAIVAMSPGRPGVPASATAPVAAGVLPATARDGAPSDTGTAFAGVFAGLQATTTATAKPGGSGLVPGLLAATAAADPAVASIDADTSTRSLADAADATALSADDPWPGFSFATLPEALPANPPDTVPAGNALPVAGRPLPSDAAAVVLDDHGLGDTSAPDAAGSAPATARHGQAAADGDGIIGDESRLTQAQIPDTAATELPATGEHLLSEAARGAGTHEPAGTTQAGTEGLRGVDAGNTAPARELAALLARLAAGGEGPTTPRPAAFADPGTGEDLLSPATGAGATTDLRPGPAAGSVTAMPADRFALAPLGDARWADGLADRLQLLASGGGSHSVRLRLYPEHLGSLDVRMRVENDNIQLWFNSPHAQVREALEASLPRLREMFAGQGLFLQDAAVGSDPGTGNDRTGAGDVPRNPARTGDDRNAQSLAGLLNSLQLRPDPKRLVDVWA